MPKVFAKPRRSRSTPQPQATPRWDAAARELWWAGRSLHVYRHVAFNQCAVLAAFEAAGWPPRVFDALYRATGKKSKQRRRNTIKSLNQMLRGAPIRFCADGTGRGICWKIRT